MSLITYEQVRPWAKSIREKVSRGQMPPWHADAPHGTFLNDRRLSERDKDILLRWVEAGAPQGEPKDLPLVPSLHRRLGDRPTRRSVLDAQGLRCPCARGTIAIRISTCPRTSRKTSGFSAVEIRPGNRSVVHHVLVYAIPPQRTPVQTRLIPQVRPSTFPPAPDPVEDLLCEPCLSYSPPLRRVLMPWCTGQDPPFFLRLEARCDSRCITPLRATRRRTCRASV